MARPHIYIKHPHPLITPRIEFQAAPRPGQPTITPRIDFGIRGLGLNPQRMHDNRDHAPAELETRDPVEDFVAYRGHHSPSSKRQVQVQAEKSLTGKNPARVRVLIPKPAGEPGRPKCGGFALEAALKQHGWEDADVELFMSDVREASKTHLDTTVSFSKQKGHLVEQICDELSAEDSWPVLEEYENCWPVRSALKLALKYGAEASRRKSGKKD